MDMMGSWFESAWIVEDEAPADIRNVRRQHRSLTYGAGPSASQYFLSGAVAVLVYVLTTRGGRIRRPPASAIAWVVGLWFLPYLILPLYLAFGRRKVKVPQTASAGAVQRHPHWAAAVVRSFGLPAPSRAAVHFHDDGAESRAGIQVRLLVDGAGLWLARRASFEALKAAGGQVKVFRPLFSLRRIGPRNLRNHRKLAIADGRRVWSGGRNLAAEYFGGEGADRTWIDLSFELDGDAAGVAARHFARDWGGEQASGPPDASGADSPIAATGVQYLPSGPDQPEDTVHAVLMSAFARAEHRALAVTPYFVPDDNLLSVMRLAVMRGVRLTLVLPRRSNHRLADFVRARALRSLAAAGADIRLVDDMVHAKAVVIDESLALCGSVNLDARSLLLNYESEFLFYGEEEVRWLSRWIEHLAQRGAQYQPDAPSLARDVAEGLMLTVAFQL